MSAAACSSLSSSVCGAGSVVGVASVGLRAGGAVPFSERTCAGTGKAAFSSRGRLHVGRVIMFIDEDSMSDADLA